MNDFHFIRPLWLLAIVVLIAAIYLLKQFQSKQSGWQEFIPNHLAKMLIDQGGSKQSISLLLPFIVGVLAIIALAGPSWKKLPQPVYQSNQGAVLIMDMSYSMFATDLSPNRVTRARYKANDLLDSLNEGEMGLVAYAGDAFTISPLTEDINNLKLLLPSLSPDIMPELGSNPLSALTLADQMLTNAGHVKGNIYWFTDGIESSDIQDITTWSREHSHRLNILGVGTKNGAPITLQDGELMKDNSGAIIVPKLPEARLKGLAERGNGVYQTIHSGTGDIENLLQYAKEAYLGMHEEDEQSELGDQWQEEGPWLVLLILPVVLYFFRRGTLLAILPLCFLMPSEQANASIWQDLWQTPDQQAQQAFEQKNYEHAANTFKDSNWQGSAHYKAGNYQLALEAFQKSDTAQALYNQGNSYAQLNQIDQAIAAYEKALAKNPDMADAKANKELLEKMKQQQEQQQQQDQEQQDQENQESQEEQNEQNTEGQQSQEQQQGNSEQQESSNEQENADQNESEQNQQEQNNAQSEQDPDAEYEEESQEKDQQGDPQQAQNQSAAQMAQEQLEQEKEQKHQQLLNKVTDDPYLLLRNKMQLEYKKRRHEQSSLGETKKW
ncbi:VWA domain-containing protein [Thalassotalea sp. PLHSN55]|uniref:VWA domain-containing protein n=1 Tax=Thalassotalea sp. PLHSN55 TaxID=3435888 RepID=UPI003F8734FB